MQSIIGVLSSRICTLYIIIIVLSGCNYYENSNNERFVSIFNGSNLEGWDGDSRFWRVENGKIVGETSQNNVTERNTFLIWEEGEPGNFELRFKYKFVEVGEELSGNSGVQVRSERFINDEEPHLLHRVGGYQPDFAVTDGVTGNLYEERGSGRLVAPPGQRILLNSQGESHLLEVVGDGIEMERRIIHTEWNEFHVYANKDTIRTHINGKFMHELIDYRPTARDKGVLAFQIHTGPPMRVEITDVELKMLE